jgi:REP element-mobilizing transposase RayT
MKYNPNRHHRKSIRLKGYDYSQPGAYFVTICTQNRECLFGEIINGKMIINDAGKMVENEWIDLPHRFTNIQLHEYVIMPNHFHAILEIVVGAPLVVAQNDNIIKNDNIVKNDNQKGQPQGITPTDKTLGDIIGAFQSIVTVKYIHCVKTKKWQQFNNKLWQRNYWEHIVRNEQELNRIRLYIKNNPKKWQNDKLNGGVGNIVMEKMAEYGEEIWMI